LNIIITEEQEEQGETKHIAIFYEISATKSKHWKKI